MPGPAHFKKQDIPVILNMSFKSVDAIKSEDGATGRIVGLSAAFGNLDSYNEIIKFGAFADTIKENPSWPVLRNHDSWNKIGFNDEPKEVKKGLQTVSVLALDTPEGKTQFALSKLAFDMEHAKDAQSIGFSVVDSATIKRDGETVKVLKKIDMWEHSFVTWGANDKAFSTGFKSWLPNQAEGFGIGDYCDNFFKFMESLGHSAKDVQDIMLKEENEKNACERLLNTMNEAINIFKS